MKTRPVLFSGAMVRALLDGSKTQTRRPVREADSIRAALAETPLGGTLGLCPFGAPGDRLWVREAWAVDPCETPIPARYRADCSRGEPADLHTRWTPSIHMPRWASRLTLEITEVRIQRLQDISDEDARAEGAKRFDDIPDPQPYKQGARWSMESPPTTEHCLGSARYAFANYWNKTNGHDPTCDCPKCWDASPWVWAVSFRKVDP